MATYQTQPFVRAAVASLLIARSLDQSRKKRLQTALAQGRPVEGALEELLHMMEEEGLRHTVEGRSRLLHAKAILYLAKNQYKKALTTCERSEALWSGDWTLRSTKGSILTVLGKYEEAFSTFESVAESAELMAGDPKEFFRGWVTVGILQVYEAILKEDPIGIEEGLRKVLKVQRRGKQAGVEQVVVDAFAPILEALSLASNRERLVVDLQRCRYAISLTLALEQTGEESAIATIARICAMPVTYVEGITVKELVARAGNLSIPEDFGDDLAVTKAGQPVWEPSPWDS